MFDTVCSYPLSDDIFSQAIHPHEPIVSVGLSSGHVETFRLPETSSGDSEGQKGLGHIDTTWRTRRHKGSCRCLAFSIDGQSLYSTGTDGIVKAAKTETGRVEAKIAVPREPNTGELDAPTLIHALSPQTLLLATDSSALHVFDLRLPVSNVSARPQQTYHPHEDYISSLMPLPPTEASTSGFSKQWITTGGTTIALTDLRRGVMVQSEDQEEELVSSTYVQGLKAGGTSQGEKLVVGGSSGVLTLWEKGVWDDQDERIIVSRGPEGGESLEVLSTVPDEIGLGKMIAVGQTDGMVQLVRMGSNKVVASLQHDEMEGVLGLGFDADGRMVSGGGSVVKVWHKGVEKDGDEDSDSDEETPKGGKDSDDSDSDSDAEDKGGKRRKRRKRGKGKDRTGGQHTLAFRDLD